MSNFLDKKVKELSLSASKGNLGSLKGSGCRAVFGASTPNHFQSVCIGGSWPHTLDEPMIGPRALQPRSNFKQSRTLFWEIPVGNHARSQAGTSGSSQILIKCRFVWCEVKSRSWEGRGFAFRGAYAQSIPVSKTLRSEVPGCNLAWP